MTLEVGISVDISEGEGFGLGFPIHLSAHPQKGEGLSGWARPFFHSPLTFVPSTWSGKSVCDGLNKLPW